MNISIFLNEVPCTELFGDFAMYVIIFGQYLAQKYNVHGLVFAVEMQLKLKQSPAVECAHFLLSLSADEITV